MKLDVARLCLDCEEVHEEQVCPACGSEVFAFLTRWVEASGERGAERPRAARAAAITEVQHPPRTPEQIEAYRQLIEGRPPQNRSGLITKGVLGLAAFSLAGWAWRSAAKSRSAREAARKETQGPRPTMSDTPLG